MTRISVGKARSEFADALNRVSYKGERLMIRRRGKDVAAIVSAHDLELLEALEDRLDLDAARKALRARGGKTWSRVKAELGL